jgi:hypothetical protein
MTDALADRANDGGIAVSGERHGETLICEGAGAATDQFRLLGQPKAGQQVKNAFSHSLAPPKQGGKAG